MSANKENVYVNERSRHTMKRSKEDKSDRWEFQSKPCLTPFRKERDHACVSERNPLRTLSYHANVENLAGPSQESSRPLDKRYVTYKNKYEELDWNFAVFNDNKDEPKTENNEKLKYNDKNIEKDKLKNQIDDLKKTEPVKLVPVVAIVMKTPIFITKTPILQENTVKKIKRSLKRPQTRLQNTTSPVSARSCHVTIYSNSDIKLHVPSGGECFDPLNDAYVMDNLDYMLQSERKVGGEPRIRNSSRSCVINWIINVNGSSGNPAVVQLASWYFDCYLSSTWVTVTRLQVIAAACFWIATKFHGRIISGKRLVKYSGNAFIEKELETAERSILKKLFQALPIAPYDFVPYLAWCSERTKAGLVEAAAVFLCQCGIMTDKTLSEEYPSVVAAASVKNALLLLRMNSSLRNLEACSIYKAAKNKAVSLDKTCAQLRDAVRVVSSVGYEYKAPLFKFSGPPYYIASNIVRAVNYKDILRLDI